MKKTILIFISSFFIFTYSLTAAASFQFDVNVPLGTSIGFINQEYNSSFPTADRPLFPILTSSAAFEWGITAQPGAYIGFGKGAGLSILFDIGYHRDAFGYGATQNFINSAGEIISKTIYNSFIIDSVVVGLYPKFNIGTLVIGIGGGIKIPVGGSFAVAGIDANDRIRTIITGLSSQDIRDTFKVPLIGYLKISADYLIFVDTRTALYLGIYVNYDFPMSMKISDSNPFPVDGVFSKYEISALDIGLQLGLRLGGKN